MRWIFADRKDSEEAREIAMLESKIADWWEAFTNKAPEFAEVFQGKANWDLPEWMIKNLNPIHEELMWEFGAAVNGPGDRLVITPESRKELRPLVESIISEAPELPGWEFYTYRLAEDLAMTAETVRSRVGTSIEGVEVAVEREEGNRIALKYVSDKFRGSEDNEALNIAFVATETLLGEKSSIIGSERSASRRRKRAFWVWESLKLIRFLSLL